MPGNQQLQPNEDLVRGDRVMITQWVKEKAYLKQRVEGVAVISELSADDTKADGDVTITANQAFFGDVLEVLAMEYPWAVFDVHTVKGQTDYTRLRVSLDVRTFDCRKVRNEYFGAVLAGKPEPAPPAAPPAPVTHKHLINISLFGIERELMPMVIKLALFFGLAWMVLHWLKGGGR